MLKRTLSFVVGLSLVFNAGLSFAVDATAKATAKSSASKSKPSAPQAVKPPAPPANPANNANIPAQGLSALPPIPPDPNKQPKPPRSYDAKPLPEAQRSNSVMNSVDEAYPHVWTSAPIESSQPDYVTTGADLIAAGLQVLELGVQEALKSGIAAKNLSLNYLKYEIGDSRTVDFLIKHANKTKLGEVVVYTDGNVVFDYTFEASDKSYSTDFGSRKMKLKDAPEGIAMKRLLDAGFILCGSQAEYEKLKARSPQKKFIIALGVYDKKKVKETPIFHQKNAVLAEINEDGSYKKGIVGVQGTYNDTGDPTKFTRYNWMAEVREQEILRFFYEQALSVRDALGNGLEIKDIKAAVHREIYFKNGEVITVRATDGQTNPNQTQAELLTRAVVQSALVKVTKGLTNEFVDTFKDGLVALRNLVAKVPGFIFKGMRDAHFADPYGFGFTPALGGYAVFRPMGPPIFPFGFQARRNFDIDVFMQPIDGVEVSSELGAPTNVALDHDKTNVWDAVIRNISYKAIFWGSLNYSGHFQSAETQHQVFALPTSKFAKAVEDNILKFIDLSRSKGFAWPVREAVARLAIKSLLEHSMFEVDRASIDSFIKIVEDKNANADDLKKAGQILRDLAQKPTTLTKKPDVAAINKIIDNLGIAANWYLTTFKPQWGVSIQQIVDILMPIVHPDMNAIQKKMAVELLCRDSKITKIQFDKNVKATWDKLVAVGLLKGAMPADDDQAVSAGGDADVAPVAPPDGHSVEPGVPSQSQKGPIGTRMPAPGTRAAADAAAKSTVTGIPPVSALNVPTVMSAPKISSTSKIGMSQPTPPAPPAPSAPTTVGAPQVRAPVTGEVDTANFFIEDFDDNFWTTSARIYLRSTTSPRKYVSVSTAEWATVKTQLGQKGPWQKFEEYASSYRDFEAGVLIKSLPIVNGKLVMSKLKAGEGPGPSYKAAQMACQTQIGCNRFFINSARDSNTDLNKLFDLLVANGEFKFRPPLANLMVGANTPEKKVANVEKVCAIADNTPIPPNAKKSLTPDGKNYVALNRVGFSDDDLMNFILNRSAATNNEIQRRFKNIKITLFYTGHQIYPFAPDPKFAAQVNVPNSYGWRMQTPEEVAEYTRVAPVTTTKLGEKSCVQQLRPGRKPKTMPGSSVPQPRGA